MLKSFEKKKINFWEAKLAEVKPTHVRRHVKGYATDLEKMAMKAPIAQFRWQFSLVRST